MSRLKGSPNGEHRPLAADTAIVVVGELGVGDAVQLGYLCCRQHPFDDQVALQIEDKSLFICHNVTPASWSADPCRVSCACLSFSHRLIPAAAAFLLPAVREGIVDGPGGPLLHQKALISTANPATGSTGVRSSENTHGVRAWR